MKENISILFHCPGYSAIILRRQKNSLERRIASIYAQRLQFQRQLANTKGNARQEHELTAQINQLNLQQLRLLDTVSLRKEELQVLKIAEVARQARHGTADGGRKSALNACSFGATSR